MCLYFTRYFDDFKTHRAPEKENLNMIKIQQISITVVKYAAT